jgi:hypothetical protein
LLALQRPTHPSDWRNDPEPLRPDRWPLLMIVMPLELPTALTAPLGLTVPLEPRPMILPLLTTTAVVLPPEQLVPTLTTTHAPSKPTPPPSLRFDGDPRGSSTGVFCGNELSGADRGSDRVPENDFSSLPMLPPALPDWARTALRPKAKKTQSSPATSRARRAVCMAFNFQNEFQISTPGTIGTYGTDDAAGFPILAAVVKRNILCPLNGVTLDKRPGFV